MPSWDYPQPFERPITVTDKDIDSLGHTNNRVYSQWCEQVAWAHSRALGLGSEDYPRLGKAMVIHEANYQYLAASFEGDELVMGSWLTASDGRLTLQRRFQLLNRVTGQCLLRARWQLVCISLESNKPARMPDEFIRCYLPHLVTAPGADASSAAGRGSDSN